MLKNNTIINRRLYIPRFSLKNVKDIGNIPINEPIKYSGCQMTKHIMRYFNQQQDNNLVHERVIQPMVW
jgi:DNA polymerase I-like protein with 3'-5' exonuclease and polymerase domains